MHGLMVLGTASDVGKSIVQTFLCRYLVNKGYRVAPFKSQNITNFIVKVAPNQYISRAQVLQAEAAKTPPHAMMNPIVLHILDNGKVEVLLHGEKSGVVSNFGYRDQFYEAGLKAIKDALGWLAKDYDLLLAEGAGSPVEINLREKELVNMKIAGMADIPAILVADIDRGGVFASIVGTLELLTDAEREHIKGIVINKFRGNPNLFADGVNWLEEKTNLPILGVLPYIHHVIEPEDSLSMPKNGTGQDHFAGDKYEQLIKDLLPYIDMKRIMEIIFRWPGK